MSTAITRLIDEWQQAVLARDIDKIVSFTPTISSRSTPSPRCNSRAGRPTARIGKTA